MSDLERYEQQCLRYEAQQDREEAASKVTPNVMQIMGKNGVVSIDTRTAHIMSVEFIHHAGDFKEGLEHRFFPLCKVLVSVFESQEQETITAVPYIFEEHGRSLLITKRYIARALQEIYLNNQEWRFNS